MIAIVDYGVGNLFSLSSSVRSLGAEVRVTRDAADLRAADHILLPGVGAFADAMAKLEATGLVPVLREETQKKPLLGICLGMQLLFDKSFEYGEHAGLGLIPGEVCPLADDLTDPALKVHRLERTGHRARTRERPAVQVREKRRVRLLRAQLLRQKLRCFDPCHQRVQHPCHRRGAQRQCLRHPVPPGEIRRYRPSAAESLCRTVS